LVEQFLSGARKIMRKIDDAEFVTASEIGAYSSCREAWRLPHNERELARGEQSHAKFAHAERTTQSGWWLGVALIILGASQSASTDWSPADDGKPLIFGLRASSFDGLVIAWAVRTRKNRGLGGEKRSLLMTSYSSPSG
jgi:hypothetical protein